MKLKYYLRGMGVGVLLTAIIMGVALGGSGSKMSDAEVIKRARQLGMVEAESTLSDYSEATKESEVTEENDESASGQKVDKEGTEVSEEVNQGESEAGESVSSMDETAKESDEVGENSESVEAEPDIALSSSASAETASTETVSAEVNNEASEETADVVNTQTETNDDQASQDNTSVNNEAAEESSVVSNSSENTNAVSESAQPTDVNYVVVVIPGGSDSDTCARIIREAGLIEDGIGFNKYLENQGLDRYIRSGTKQIPRGASFEEIARIITR